MGTAMGAVTGMLIAPINYLDPSMMGDVALKAFAGGCVGGLTSLPGAVVGGCCSASSTASSDSKCLSFATPSRRPHRARARVRPGGLLGRHETKKV